MIQKIKTWFKKRKLTSAIEALRHLIANKDPEIYKEIRECAEIMARKMCMRWLDNNGLQHCKECPNTKPLIQLNGVYFCAGHASKHGNAVVEPPPLSVIRP